MYLLVIKITYIRRNIMAHFAKLGANGKVIQVLTLE